ncbi:contractile ring myosin V regulator Rng8 [Schizosaccharomyces osmophilus]|uniref:Contractile ring myosin V regulator Rng8 n=1 Tax=Schizosaccharomyces osmophilus TaxID=2545709 RepID=A0AAF0AZ83_9SCHI|nr:contractile ring myosin V regulator Rng8 [Schizosaccharomyces osmophilus]WBW75560.1 contractile ring myosin V regulator Rng8 [Schizosaccharomyces osmophilus]
MSLQSAGKVEIKIQETQDEIENGKDNVKELHDMANTLDNLSNSIGKRQIPRNRSTDVKENTTRKASSGQMIAAMQNEIDHLKVETEEVKSQLNVQKRRKKELESKKLNLINLLESLKMQETSIANMVNRKQRTMKEDRKMHEGLELQISKLQEEKEALKEEIGIVESEMKTASEETETYTVLQKDLEKDYDKVASENLKKDPEVDEEVQELNDTFQGVEGTILRHLEETKQVEKPLRDSMTNSSGEKEKIAHSLEKAKNDAHMYSSFIENYLSQLCSNLDVQLGSIGSTQSQLSEMQQSLEMDDEEFTNLNSSLVTETTGMDSSYQLNDDHPSSNLDS